jgi:hypothetical protein
MKYDYSIVLNAVPVTSCDVFTGEVEGSTPLEAFEQVLVKRTDWLEDILPGLSPTIEIERQLNFEAWKADVDSHGLGTCSIILQEFGSMPEGMKIS